MMQSFVVYGTALLSRALLVALMVLSVANVASADTPETSGANPPGVGSALPHTYPRQKTYMKRKWGVEVLWVKETAAGYMLEFRYKVLDAEKASALFDRQTKPVLIHERTGAEFAVPTPAKTGALRNSNEPIAGKNYWMFFANPGKYVKPGDLVSIRIGDYLQQGIPVR